MDKVCFLTTVRNLKKNLLLLFSSGAVLCLFLSPSMISLIMTGILFIALCVAALFDMIKPQKAQHRYVTISAALVAMLIDFIGCYTYYTTWIHSGKATVLANMLGHTTLSCFIAVGLFNFAAGFYALFVLGQWIANIGYAQLQEKLPVREKTSLITNLKGNWVFLISAMAFCCLSMTNHLSYCFGIVVTISIYFIIASQTNKLWQGIKEDPIPVTIIYILNAIGICWADQQRFTELSLMMIEEYGFPQALDSVFFIIGVFGAVVSVPFIYVCVRLLWRKMIQALEGTKLFSGISRTEFMVYAMLFLASMVLCVVAFSGSQAFYGTDLSYDIIYTSDSPALVKGKVYMSLTHSENDLRQPLFAVFAAPFMGIPYLIGRVILAPESVQAMLLNSVQILMLFLANFMLAKVMKLTRVNRVCYMVLASLTYMHILFTLMMEQYIVAYFWLIFCIYLICEKKRPDRFVLWGAGGTMLTSMVLLPGMSDKSPIKDFKAWIGDMIKYGIEFIAVMLVCCRFDVIFNSASMLYSLGRYTGKHITFMDKIHHYTVFVGNCFAAPNAGINHTAEEHVSWQLAQPTTIGFFGVLIVVLCIISAWINRDKKSSRIAIGWVGFSAIILLGLGWGIKENGLILYALYFGWAFLLLLFQLVENISERINLRFLIPVATVVCAALLMATNIPEIVEMIRFAIQHYPT